jgi:hypothetical protein
LSKRGYFTGVRTFEDDDENEDEDDQHRIATLNMTTGHLTIGPLPIYGRGSRLPA